MCALLTNLANSFEITLRTCRRNAALILCPSASVTAVELVALCSSNLLRATSAGKLLNLEQENLRSLENEISLRNFKATYIMYVRWGD